MAFVSATVPNKNFIWNYYALKPEKEYSDFVKEVFGDNATNFYKVAEYLIEQTPLTIKLIISDNDFRDLCFNIYLKLYDFQDYLKENDENLKLEVFFETTQRLMFDLEKNIVQKIIKVIDEDLTLCVHNLHMRDEFNKHGRSIVKKLIKTCWPNINALTDKINKSVGGQIITEVENRNLIHELYSTIKDDLKDYTANSDFFCIDKINAMEFERILESESRSKLDYKLTQSGLCNIFNLSKYNPQYAGVSFNIYYDHGVFSALAAIELQQTFILLNNKLIEKPGDKASKLEKILRLGIGVGARSDDLLLMYQCKGLMQEALYSVCIHNIRPCLLNGESERKFRTDLQTEPFAFVCLLADSLQPWERERIINQSLLNLPYSTYGDGFDFIIQGNSFYITEVGDNLEIEKRSDDLRNFLDEYLRGASQMVKLTLCEWKHL
jgi:hypothetical protein